LLIGQQEATNLDNPVWQGFGAPTSGNSLAAMPTNAAAFYRIFGGQ